MKKQLFVMSLVCVASNLPADCNKSSGQVCDKVVVTSESKDPAQHPALLNEDTNSKKLCAKLIVNVVQEGLNKAEGESPKAPQTNEPVDAQLTPQMQDALSSK